MGEKVMFLDGRESLYHTIDVLARGLNRLPCLNGVN